MTVGITCEDPVHPFEVASVLGATQNKSPEAACFDFVLEKLDAQKQAIAAQDWRSDTIQTVARLESQILYALKRTFNRKADRAIDLFYRDLRRDAIDAPNNSMMMPGEKQSYAENLSNGILQAGNTLNACAQAYEAPITKDELHNSALSVSFKLIETGYIKAQERMIRNMKASADPLKPKTALQRFFHL